MVQAVAMFPGQGAQSVGMGKDIVQASPRARAIFERAGDILGFDIAKACFEGPADTLARTDIQQPAIFTVSVALWEAYLDAGGSLDHFARAGGLSLGEYTALHIAGAVGFEEALTLVHRRGQLMQEAALAAPSGMVSLIGADEDKALALCARARDGDVLEPANFNCPGQIVVSGARAACDRALALAHDFECRAVALPVAGAFHSPLMAPAAEGLSKVLKDTRFTEPSIPVISNVDAEYHSTPDSIRETLQRQLTNPVCWQRCIERLIADSADCFVEIGPGKVLTGLMRKIDRRVNAVNACDAESIGALVAMPVSS